MFRLSVVYRWVWHVLVVAVRAHVLLIVVLRVRQLIRILIVPASSDPYAHAFLLIRKALRIYVYGLAYVYVGA